MKRNLFIYLLIIMMPLAISCSSGGSGSSGSGSSSSGISSLNDIPSVSDMVSTGSANASVSALMKAVSGTPPYLVDIDEDNADTYFWDGLIADINTNGVDSEEDIHAFWEGESGCRMAQDVGYSFQTIGQSGTALCYMKNMPDADSGVSVLSGDVDDPTTMFDQQEDSFIVKVNSNDMPMMTPDGMDSVDEDIFIEVKGTTTADGADGYAVDLWFCPDGGGTARGYEQIRVNDAAQTITQTSVQTDWGDYVAVFEGTVTEEDGQIVFDDSQEQVVSFVVDDDMWGIHKGAVVVNGTEMQTKAWESHSWDGMDEIMKHYMVSTFSATSLLDLSFTEAGVAMDYENDDGFADAFFQGLEYQDTYYVNSIETDLFADVDDYDFDGDSFFDGTLEVDADLLDAVADYDCSATPDIEVEIDNTDSEIQSIGEECENIFSDMHFCDSESVMQARQAVMDAEALYHTP